MVNLDKMLTGDFNDMAKKIGVVAKKLEVVDISSREAFAVASLARRSQSYNDAIDQQLLRQSSPVLPQIN